MIESLRKDIQDRLDEIARRPDAATGHPDERLRLEQALRHLEAPPREDHDARPPRGAKRRVSPNGHQRRANGPENRAKVLAAVTRRPGAAEDDLAAAAEVTRPVVRAALAKLVADGALRRVTTRTGSPVYVATPRS